MPTISVEHVAGSTYRVTVTESDGASQHDVTVTPETLRRYAPGGIGAERLIHASFEFLLARESRDSILRRFELPVIERYFPDYGDEIRRKLGDS